MRRPIKFVKALVVASGLAGLSGCGRVGLVDPPLPGGDAGQMTVADAGRQDAGQLDSGIADAGALDCRSCACFGIDAGLPACETVNRADCCFAVGPLPPPDLPALT